MTRPLEGFRVVEVCHVASGPFCGMLLADLGADVVKIENPAGGDSMRSWPPISDGYSENFASLNRNKRSVALDLKDDGQRRTALDLMAGADVVVENNRPGVMGRLRLGYQEVVALNPAIVYCSISAFGQEGPRRAEAGFDLTVQAMSGIMSVTGERDGDPVKCGVPISDFATGLYGAFAIVSALHQARATGRGVHIDASMLGSSLAIAALQTSQLFGSGVDPVALGAAHPRNAPYEVFACRDGHVAMAAGNDGLFAAFCRAFGRPELVEDPRFVSTVDRAAHQGELKRIVEDIFATRDRSDVLEALRDAGVPGSPLNKYSEALDDPQVEAMGWVEPLELPNGTVTRTFGSPLRFDGRGFPVYRHPPALGEHTGEVCPDGADLRSSEAS
ncbi:CaiB/BaiF CoA transferase family protein [Streptomyces sp. TP-A0874]|uniref:CaiB/BaiF CoA transferase family protein n=1 Tax=Streptomyces sp. TP-A0874 TaxID=549819 RepID=UPI000852AD07|nr:CoA transferase [Streptomyces sp. TP-A0874]